MFFTTSTFRPGCLAEIRRRHDSHPFVFLIDGIDFDALMDASESERDVLFRSWFALLNSPHVSTVSDAMIRGHWAVRAGRADLSKIMSRRYPKDPRFGAAESALLVTEIERFLAPVAGRGRPVDSVVEFGCGVGQFTKFLAQVAERVCAIDFTEEMLSAARAEISRGQGVVEFRLSDVTSVALKERFDLVFSSLLLVHILSDVGLKAVIDRMARAADYVFICEHTEEHRQSEVSKFTVLRSRDRYVREFSDRGYDVLQETVHGYCGDSLSLILFKRRG